MSRGKNLCSRQSCQSLGFFVGGNQKRPNDIPLFIPLKAPSPIIEGEPISLPIPTGRRSETTYGAAGFGQIVEEITKGRIGASDLCHEDPMFSNGRWAFGQTGAAQTHLATNGVGLGDVFLFFGLFALRDGSDRHHRIFGYMQLMKFGVLAVGLLRMTIP